MSSGVLIGERTSGGAASCDVASGSPAACIATADRAVVSTTFASRCADYIELTKPRIAVLELVTVALSAYVSRWVFPDTATLAYLLIGTALTAAGAGAWNQWLEIATDARMHRTADRPLVAGRLSPRQVAWFGTWTSIGGVGLLAVAVNAQTALFGFLTWFLYVVVYTPMKRSTPLNTVVGAVAGAMPVLMGCAANEGRFTLSVAALAMIVFLWQFPHFMAISWIYKDQYARAGLQMLSVVDPSGRRCGAQAVVTALILIPVSLLPAVIDSAGSLYFAWALALGLAQLGCAVWFMLCLDERSARVLLRASLIYLPSLLLMLILGPFS
ncbi:MAG: heme o synthase [Planctomycetia bacterium]|nr:heme o synthase [Planctomycetia bacterium]